MSNESFVSDGRSPGYLSVFHFNSLRNSSAQGVPKKHPTLVLLNFSSYKQSRKLGHMNTNARGRLLARFLAKIVIN